MTSSVLPFAPLPDPMGSSEPTNAENTEAFVAALAAALGLVPVARPARPPGAGLGLGELQTNADMALVIDAKPMPTAGATGVVPGLLDEAAPGPTSQQLAGQHPDTTDGPARIAPSALMRQADNALKALTTPQQPAADVDGTAVRSAAEGGSTGRFTVPQDLVDAATKQAAELGTAQKISIGTVGDAEKKQPNLSNGGAQTRGGSGEGPSLAPVPAAQVGTTPMTRAMDVTVGDVTDVDVTAEPAPAPKHQAQVDVVDANGDRATIRVALRGTTVRTTIVHADGRVVEDLRANSVDLQRALNEQGLAARIRVYAAGGSAVVSANDSAASNNDVKDEQREQSRQRDSQGGDDWSTRRDGREQRDANSRSRREGER